MTRKQHLIKWLTGLVLTSAISYTVAKIPQQLPSIALASLTPIYKLLEDDSEVSKKN